MDDYDLDECTDVKTMSGWSISVKRIEAVLSRDDWADPHAIW